MMVTSREAMITAKPIVKYLVEESIKCGKIGVDSEPTEWFRRLCYRKKVRIIKR